MTSRVAIALDGSTRLFTVPFPYIQPSHVLVMVNNILQNNPLDYQWTPEGAIEFWNAPAGVLTLVRKTPIDEALVVFRNGTQLTEDELNLAVLQNLYAAQEIRDYYDALIDGTLDKMIAATGVQAGPIIDQVVETILESEELANLQARIADIDFNAVSINAQAVRLDTLQDTVDALADVDGTGITTFLLDEQNARIDGDTALQETIDIMGAKSGDGLSFVFDTAKVKVSPTESLATRLSGIASSIAANAAAIATEQTARATQDSAFTDQLSSLSANVGANTALVTSEQTARASADSALSSRIDTLQSNVNGNTAAILSESSARATGDSANASSIAALQSTVNSNFAAFQSEQTTRANADTALSNSITTLTGTVNGNTAAIQTEQTARANGDSANASSIATLQTTVNGNTASISTQQTTIDGLKANYMVKLDVNGYVSGIGLYNNGATSSFLVLADKFAVVTPGKSPVVPFAVDATGVYMNTAYIRNLVVDKISGGAITSQWNLNTGGGKIVLDTGSYMKVIGVGFGANSDLIEWFGPKMAITACTKANATTYVGTDGSAYFGGVLRAGTFYNAAQTTTFAIPTDCLIDPVASNGNPRVIALAFDYYRANGRGGNIGNGTGGTITLKLYRSINGAAETVLGTYTVTCTKYSDPNGDGTYDVSESGNLSLTYTDSNTSTGPYRYRWQAFSSSGLTAVAGTGAILSQKLSIVCTEQ